MALQTKALLSSKWLVEALKSPPRAKKMCILDTSWYLPKLRRNAKQEFKRRHIPGAAFFDIDRCCDRTSPLDHMLPPEDEFADYVGKLGIERDTHVVVYDSSDFGAFSAPRVWWMFRVFGHRKVSVLDGGMRSWEAEGRQVSDRYVRPAQTEFRASLNRSWVRTYEDLLDNLESRRFQVVDARPAGRFRGLQPEPRDNTEPGHIPFSINIPFVSLLSPSSGHFLPGEGLLDVFLRAGVDPRRPLCLTCGSAVTACHLALAAREAGLTGGLGEGLKEAEGGSEEGIKEGEGGSEEGGLEGGHPWVTVYDGGWSEWFARAAPEHVASEGRGKHLIQERLHTNLL